MEQSILKSTKKILGLEDDYTPFDLDIITHINASFSVLEQLGVGPEGGFFIEDAVASWEEFVVPPVQLNLVKTYVYLKVRLLFDPPGTSFLINAATEQLKEYEWRLNTFREYDLREQATHTRTWRGPVAIIEQPQVTPLAAGRRWIDVNRNPITGEPLDGAE